MPVLQASDIADITVTTLKNLGKLKMTDIMSTYQNTIFFKRLAKKGKMDFQDGGDETQFNLITGTNGSARSVGLYYTANVNPTNVMTTGKMPWRHVTWNWSLDAREQAMNAPTANKIVDLVKTRRTAAFGDAVLLFENKGWRVPAVTNTDDFMGVPYWVVKSNTAVTTNDGFNGTVPSGYTLVGNINPTTYSPKWNNYATQYTTISKDDLITKLERASDYTDFMPLVDDTSDYNTGDDYGFYTTYAVKQGFKQILEAQNENLGFDLDPANDKLTYRRSRVTWVKELDLDTTDPIYGLNWGVFQLIGLKGWWLHETHFAELPTQPTVQATHYDCTINTICRDRRRNFVLATNTTMGY